MKKIYTSLLLIPFFAVSQVTLKVTSIPANTPVGANIHVAGTVNDWNPADENYILQPDGFGNLQVVIPEGTGTAEYKFTRGGWPTVEGNATGGFLPNRSFTFSGIPQTINLTIQSWEDLGSGANSTAAANVQILNAAFYIPQLDRNRRIWLYFPPDYNTSAKHYPVLYMQDGQNLFDAATSFAGEWQVDETLNTLFANGDYGAIVVGIDNGGGERLNEYSPWIDTEYGGGDGDDYMDFIANTLKPYIDSNYRTRPEPVMNALIGSSMGGLISTYGVCEFPGVFRKAGAMSPSYWFAGLAINDYITTSVSNLENQRIYFVSGTSESASMVPDINTVRGNLLTKGLAPANAFTKFDSYGTHSESYWRGEFSALYQWLFANETLSVNSFTATAPKVMQTLSGKLYAEGFISETDFQIINMLGASVQKITLSNGTSELPETLSKGVYILQSGSNEIKPIRIIKN